MTNCVEELRNVQMIFEFPQRGRESGDKGKQSLQSSPLLQHQTSTDDVDQPSAQLVATESRSAQDTVCRLSTACVGTCTCASCHVGDAWCNG